MTYSSYSYYRWCGSDGQWHSGYPDDDCDYDKIEGCNSWGYWSDCTPKRDGYVDGTASGELIDGSYTGDPQGDRIDANDAILAGATGNDDWVRAGGGNDTVRAGLGHDRVYGGDGNDSLDGQDGNDTLHGEAGNDTLSGGAGCNAEYGGSGDDLFKGGAGQDTFDGGAGQDNIDYSASATGVTVNLSTGAMAGGDAANDHISGGIDGVIGSNQADSLTGFDHQGTAASDTYTNQFWGNGGNDTISGLGGNDQLYGGADQDKIYGGSGDDRAEGGAGNDLIEGGTGQDTLYGDDASAAAASPVVITLTGDAGAYDCKLFAYSINPVTGAISNIVYLNNDTDVGIGTSYTYSVAPGTVMGVGIVSPDGTFYSSGYGARVGLNGDGMVHTKALGVDANGAVNIGFEDLNNLGDKDFNDVTVKVNLGTSGATFDNAHYTYTSTAPDGSAGGADTILAGDGNDLVYGGGGNDQLSGENDNDTISGDKGDDTINGGAGVDVLSGGDDRDYFVGGNAGDAVDGNEGGVDNDTLDLRGLAVASIVYDPLNSENGTVNFVGGGSMSFKNIENILRDLPPDGYVDGTAGGDLIDGSYVDPNGDRIDANDAILPGAGPNDDHVRAGDGNDTIKAGAGNDIVYAGKGDDQADGGDGNDTLYGEDGDDKLAGGVGNNALYGGAGNDNLDGGSGNDLLDGGAGDDTIYAGNGLDTIYGGAGSDLVYGGPDNDLIDTGSGTQRPDIGYPGLYPADTDPNDDKDTVYGGSGHDTIRTGDDADVIHANEGNDLIDAGVDNDTIDGDAGDDTIIGAEGSDSVTAGSGNDVVYGGYGPGVPDSVNIPDATDLAPNNGRDFIDGEQGDDTIFGMDDDDTLVGGEGADVIDGGIDEDLIDGGQNNDSLIGGQGNDTVTGGIGSDTITGGEGADSLFGGQDRDTFIGGSIGDAVDGNEEGDDFDTLDLSGAGPLKVIYDPTNPENGTVEFLDPTDRHVIGTMTFKNIENVIPCFTPGTLIATPRGEVPVENLKVGDKIITRDNGMQEIRWLGRRDLSWNDLAAAPHLKPILIRQGSLGNGLPERDMLVSPNHRLLVANDRTALYFDEHEVLVAAKHLAAGKGIHSVDAAGASYIHFMCDRHEVVLSNGAWTETFQPGDMTLKGMGNAQRLEIFELFPELQSEEGIDSYVAARKTLKKHEARLILG